MEWQDCVVIYIDLPGIKKLAREGNSEASSLMREFHELVQSELKQSEDLPNIKYAYVWNDSAALLSYGKDTFKACLKDADQLKRKIDSLATKRTCAPAYGIAVQGQAFPSHVQSSVERVTVLQTSSFAMANCFLIEEAVKSNNCKKPWYIDDRLVEYISSKPCCVLSVELLPNEKRKIHLIDGYLWDED